MKIRINYMVSRTVRQPHQRKRVETAYGFFLTTLALDSPKLPGRVKAVAQKQHGSTWHLGGYCRATPATTGAVYLLHFSSKVGHAQHYVGYVKDARRVDERLAQHQAKRGGRLPAAAAARGIIISLARTWVPGTQALERKFKRAGNHPRLCPLCRAEQAARLARKTLSGFEQGYDPSEQGIIVKSFEFHEPKLEAPSISRANQ